MNRTTRWGTLAVLAAILLPCALAAQENDPKEADKSKEVSLEWPCPAKGKPRLRLAANVSLQDGLVLKLSISRLEEQAADWHLAAMPLGDARISSASVERGRCLFFGRTEEFVDPGMYRAVVEVPPNLQAPALREAALKIAPRTWEFTFLMWGDDWLAPCGPALPQVQAQVDGYFEVADHLDRAIKECTSTEDWTGRFLPELVKDMNKSSRKMDASWFYPATFREISQTTQTLGPSLPYCRFENGQFVGVNLPVDLLAKGCTPSAFLSLRKNLPLIREVAGREFALWVLKDFRRTGKASPALLEAVREHAELPGVKFFADRLQNISEDSDLAQLEKDIRR